MPFITVGQPNKKKKRVQSLNEKVSWLSETVTYCIHKIDHTNIEIDDHLRKYIPNIYLFVCDIIVIFVSFWEVKVRANDSILIAWQRLM